MDVTAPEINRTDVTANEKKRKGRQILKRAGDKQKKQKVLESFFCPPAASLTDIEAVEIALSKDLESEPGRRAAATIDV